MVLRPVGHILEALSLARVEEPLVAMYKTIIYPQINNYFNSFLIYIIDYFFQVQVKTNVEIFIILKVIVIYD